jgi:lipopolysaccharide export system protein LptC
MSASHSPDLADNPHPVRPRPQLISTLRVALPAFAIGLTLLVIAWTTVTALLGASHETAPLPLTVASPRLSGQDDKDRPYTVIARTATREAVGSQKIDLDHPLLTRDEGGPDFLRVVAASGVYDQQAGKLALSGGVQISGARGEFSTPSTIYDTKTGDIVGPGAVQGSGDIGQLKAGSVSVTGNGKSVVYKGGVRARLNAK